MHLIFKPMIRPIKQKVGRDEFTISILKHAKNAVDSAKGDGIA